MTSYIFYESYKNPFYFEIDRLQNKPSSSKQGKAGVQSPLRSFQPRLDLHEDTEKNLVTATFEFPGIPKDNIQINFQHGNLTVSAESQKKSENGGADTGYTLRERLHGKFSRTLQLPQGVKEEHIKASMGNGLLIVTFPKTLPELAPKKISITDVDSDYDKDF